MTPHLSGRAKAAVVLLACALALAVAVAVGRSPWTDAAWTNREHAVATFHAVSFQTQSQAAGSTGWAHHPTGDPAQLFLDQEELAPGGTRLEPAAGPSIYSWFNVRTSPDTDTAAHLSLTDVSAVGDLAAAVDYRVVARTASTAPCSAADFTADASYLAGSATGYAHLTGWVSPEPSVPLGAHGTDPAGLCVEMRLAADAPNSYQGTHADVVWSFTVTQAEQ